MRMIWPMTLALVAVGCNQITGIDDLKITKDAGTDTDTDADTDTEDCVPEDHLGCGEDNDVHWFDSCGEEGELVEDCPDPNGECVDGQCQCQGGWGETDCSTCARFVDISADDDGEALSWDDAAHELQTGIDSAFQAVFADNGIDVCEVWVAQGTYYVWNGDDENAIELRDDVNIYGGFAGGETSRSERDFKGNLTLLSGYDGPLENSNVFHVLYGGGDAIIDGFTITGGHADSSPLHVSGGGMIVYAASPVVRNCVFVGNQAQISGGAIATFETLSLEISNCVFEGNSAGELGGALLMDDDSSITITNSIFADNNSGSNGGALAITQGTCTIVNSTLYSNFAVNDGGSIYNDLGNVEVTNSIVWDGEPSEIHDTDLGMPTVVSYSDVEGNTGYDGDGNINLDPLLVDPDGGDFHLQASSPCIDAANGDLAPPIDSEGNPRVDDPGVTDTGVGIPTYVDMGAFEFQP